MADKTAIEWTDATWQITTGCSVVSPGCTNCYAQRLAGTRLQHHPSRQGLTTDSKAGPVWNGKVRFNEEWLDQPLHWKRPRRVFVSAHGDLFHENIADDWIDRVFAVMALAPQHTFQVLTKRAERMHRYMTEVVKGPWAGRAHVIEDDGTQRPMTDVHFRINGVMCDLYPKVPPQALNFASKWADDHYPDGDGFLRCWPLPNVWLGVSVEDQQRADERIPLLLDTPASKRFISAEPLLGPIDISPWLNVMVESQDIPGYPAWTRGLLPSLDWVICGGESGPGARPMHPRWARDLRDQCQDAGIAFFYKQTGEWRLTPAANGDETWPAQWFRDRAPRQDEIAHMERVGKKAAGRMLDGRTWDEFPA